MNIRNTLSWIATKSCYFQHYVKIATLNVVLKVTVLTYCFVHVIKKQKKEKDAILNSEDNNFTRLYYCLAPVHCCVGFMWPDFDYRGVSYKKEAAKSSPHAQQS